jgi:hypothetical protein
MGYPSCLGDVLRMVLNHDSWEFVARGPLDSYAGLTD